METITQTKYYLTNPFIDKYASIYINDNIQLVLQYEEYEVTEDCSYETCCVVDVFVKDCEYYMTLDINNQGKIYNYDDFNDIPEKERQSIIKYYAKYKNEITNYAKLFLSYTKGI